MERAGCQQGDVRVGATRRLRFQAFDEAAVGGRQAAHAHGLEGFGKLRRDRQPVLQQVAQARGRLRALRHHPPAAAGIARQIEGEDVQVLAAHRRHAVHGAQVVGVALHQRGRDQAVLEQPALAVQIAHGGFEQARALQHAGLDERPVGGRHQQRKQVQGPGALQPRLVGVDVVGDAVVAQMALQCGGAAFQVVPAGLAQMREEAAPGGCQRSAVAEWAGDDPLVGLAGAAAQLVEMLVVGERRARARRCGGVQGMLQNRLMGNTACGPLSHRCRRLTLKEWTARHADVRTMVAE